MLRQRVISVLILLPLGIGLTYFGGWYFAALVLLMLLLAGTEYVNMWKSANQQPSSGLIWLGIGLLVLSREYQGFNKSALILTSIILYFLIYHIFQYERGNDEGGSNFALSITGTIYIGWLGAYLISIRNQPDGFWWLLLVLPAIWLADTGAYFIGKAYGKRSLSPRLSPNKTWEGYLAGIVFGTVGTTLLALAWIATGQPAGIQVWHGALLGFVISILAPIGDLGESLFKRQLGVKDSGNIIPGHGGIFDRIDSWLWAAPIGYYIIRFLTAYMK